MRTDTQRGMEQQELVDVDCYRKLVKNFVDLRRYQTALFWAEKVTVLSNNDPLDVYWEAQCMFLLRQFHRAAYTIRSRGLEKTNLLCHYLVAECLTEAKEFQSALTILNSVDCEKLPLAMTGGRGEENESIKIKDESVAHESNDGSICEDSYKNDILASVYFLKGKVLEAMDNRVLAMDCYVQALHKSVHCTEALDALVQHDMLMAWEEKELIQHIPMAQQCTESEKKIMKRLYESKLKKYYESIAPNPNLEHPPVPSMNTSLWHEIKEKMKNSKNNETQKPSVSKYLSPAVRQRSKHPQIMSPANKLLQDLKTTPSYLIHTSLTKASLLGTSVSAGSTILSSGGPNCSRQETSFRIHRPPVTPGSSSVLTLAQSMSKLELSIDLMIARAEKYFYNCDYRQCMKILEEILKRDPYHKRSLTVQIGCLAEMKNFNRMFYVAHKLVDFHPDDAIAWYAVGCYYDIIGKSDPARRYLSKATSLDRLYSPAWLAYGHSFAKENEHDQAMAAYFKATQLMRGCHLPLLYIGVECGLTKNPEMAEKFFYQAMSIAPLDVFVLHELGVIKFDYEQYESAEEIFRSTLDMVRTMAKQNNEQITARWEPLINNLGHCCRKNKKYEEALEFHQWALSLKPQNAVTYTAIGFVHALMGELTLAVDAFHKSLSLKRDDVFTTTILKYAIEDLAEEQSLPFYSVDDVEVDVDAPNIDEAEEPKGDENLVDDPSTERDMGSANSANDDAHGTSRPTLRMQLNFDDWYNKTPPMSDTSADDMSIDI
ncbi:cell division cycle protein 16 homolog [Anopheles ziemanni]|uniref:cell division cycle protein 16 homolog n=1 Tax=Anopheles coustani TaxID=139045 RepID=UPI00265880FE|nr:cell division cycle protein 16 homolog [Anopheles coustani]XP_058171026.1 cell division cycle protein 16 homolog [Anopheles ziemanni]